MDVDGTTLEENENNHTINETPMVPFGQSIAPKPGYPNFIATVKEKVGPRPSMSSLAVSSQETANFKTGLHSIRVCLACFFADFKFGERKVGDTLKQINSRINAVPVPVKTEIQTQPAKQETIETPTKLMPSRSVTTQSTEPHARSGSTVIHRYRFGGLAGM